MPVCRTGADAVSRAGELPAAIKSASEMSARGVGHVSMEEGDSYEREIAGRAITLNKTTSSGLSVISLSVIVFRSHSPSRPLGVTRRCAASGISASARTG